MNTFIKTVGIGQIDWSGFKRVIVHTGLIALAAGVAYLISLAKGYDFGQYQALATIILGFVATFAEKFFGSYDVSVPIPPQPPQPPTFPSSPLA